MKCKVFRGTPNGLETEINLWLSANPGSSLRITDVKLTCASSTDSYFVLIFYSE